MNTTAQKKDGLSGCLICGSKPKARGLCSKHYTHFQRRREQIPPDFRRSYEADLIKAGVLLDHDRPGPRGERTQLDDLAEKYLHRYGDIAVAPDEPQPDELAILKEADPAAHKPKITAKKTAKPEKHAKSNRNAGAEGE